jgi:putative ABC transport system permease protein
MKQLSYLEVAYIITDLKKRGLFYENLKEDVLDHICTSVEVKISEGTRFAEAYHEVIMEFGNSTGLMELQRQSIHVTNLNLKIMITNYLKITKRNLLKHKFYTAINILGLAIGLACSLIMALYVADELSYDRYHENSSRIYRVDPDIRYGGKDLRLAVGPAPLAEALKNDYPEVESATRFRSWGSFLVKKTDENFKENNVIWADPSVFKVFSFDVIKGNAETALNEPNSIAISTRIAEKYFKGENPLGQFLTLDDNRECKITAVYTALPKNSHFHFDIMIAMEGLEESKNSIWLSNNFNTYITLREGADPKQLAVKFPELLEKYIGPQVTQIMGISYEDLEKSGSRIEYFLTPLTDIHLHSNRTAELEPNGNIAYVYIFSAVAIFILILACVNFMNLSTAKSADRAKEVGIRKVMGSYRVHLIKQFLTESIVLCLIAFVIALSISAFFTPYFNELTGKDISIPLDQPVFFIGVILSAMFIGTLSGIYPAFFLSGFRPLTVLQGKLSPGSKGSLIRNSLVVFQFTISILLIIGTTAVYKQLNYIQTKNLGFNKDQVMIVKDAYALGDQVDAFKNMVLQHAEISNATVSGFLPIPSNRSDSGFWPFSEKSVDNSVSMQKWRIDYDYIETLDMKIVDGRNFSRDFPSDSSAMILNEKAAKLFGFENPVGQVIETFAFLPGNQIDQERTEKFNVVGVVEDFHFESLKNNIDALCFIMGRNAGMISFKFNPTHTQDVIKTVESTWKNIASNQPFQYSFMDDDFARMYSQEQNTAELLTIFTGLAILIACLGLFALSAFTTEQRTKEIGIRKVLGASASNIVMLLSREFSLLIVIAFILSLPAAWYGISVWLRNFEFKADPGIFIYITSGLIALIVAWLTISLQSVRAALANPADSLRDQ